MFVLPQTPIPSTRKFRGLAYALLRSPRLLVRITPAKATPTVTIPISSTLILPPIRSAHSLTPPEQDQTSGSAWVSAGDDTALELSARAI